MKIQWPPKFVMLCIVMVMVLMPTQGAGAAGTRLFADQGVGGSHSLLLRADGSVWSVGYNRDGQLGNGNRTDRSVAQQVPGISNVTAVSSGTVFSLALQADGTVWGWGNNSSGQLGDGTTALRTLPVQVQGLSNVMAITSSNSHSMALKTDGTVWAWGGNGSGELGDGTTTGRLQPVQVQGLTDVVSIASSNYHSLALKEDGTVWSWGSNIFGQLGDGRVGMQYNSSIPKKVNGLSHIVGFKSGIGHTLALKSDGTVWAWGDNSSGQLGDGTKTRRTTPIKIPGLNNVTMVGAGGYSSFALKADGTVWSWGNNNAGQLGNGSAGSGVLADLGLTGTVQPVTYVAVPQQIMSGVIAISTESQHAFALKEDYTVWAWGKNEFGQLGDGTQIFRITPVLVFADPTHWQPAAVSPGA